MVSRREGAEGVEEVEAAITSCLCAEEYCTRPQHWAYTATLYTLYTATLYTLCCSLHLVLQCMPCVAVYAQCCGLALSILQSRHLTRIRSLRGVGGWGDVIVYTKQVLRGSVPCHCLLLVSHCWRSIDVNVYRYIYMIYKHIYICIYTYIYIHIYAYTHVLYICIYLQIYACIFAYISYISSHIFISFVSE